MLEAGRMHEAVGCLSRVGCLRVGNLRRVG